MKRYLSNGVAIAVAALVAAGCGDGVKKKEDAGGEKTAAEKETITQKGSDTMVLLAQAWAEAFAAKNNGALVQVTGGGSGTGISALINGTTDIANSSRPMKDDERAQIKAKYGVDVIEIPVALDGIAIYVHPDNKVEEISVAQLRDIYTGKITDWKDVGGAPGRIILYGRENSSGTYEFFKDHVLNKADFVSSTQTLSGTAAIVNAVSKDPMGMGYGGEAYAKGIKALKVKGDGAAIALTMETVSDGSYPLSRKLFLYLRQQPSGAIKTYVDWVLSAEGQEVVKKVGYFPIK